MRVDKLIKCLKDFNESDEAEIKEGSLVVNSPAKGGYHLVMDDED